MVEPAKAGRQPGLREVLIVAICVVASVIGLAAATRLLPSQVQDVVFDTPFVIVVLIVATGLWLWRVSRRQSEGCEP